MIENVLEYLKISIICIEFSDILFVLELVEVFFEPVPRRYSVSSHLDYFHCVLCVRPPPSTSLCVGIVIFFLYLLFFWHLLCFDTRKFFVHDDWVFFFVHDSWSCRVDLEWMLRDRHPIDFVIIFFSCYLKSSKSVCSLRMWNIAQCFHKNNSFVIVNLFNRKKTRERRMFNLFVSLFGWCACASAWAWFYTWGSVPSSPSHAKLCANTNRVPMWSSWTIESRQKWMKKKKKKTN